MHSRVYKYKNKLMVYVIYICIEELEEKDPKRLKQGKWGCQKTGYMQQSLAYMLFCFRL